MGSFEYGPMKTGIGAVSVSQFLAVPGDGNDMEFGGNCASVLVPLQLKTATTARCFGIF